MFYIQTPMGQISLHVLENCVFARLEYLELLYHNRSHEFNGNFEYLLENSVYDKIGHFTLRLLASTSFDLWNYWITRELLLFRSRLNCIIQKQLYRLFRSILRQLQFIGNKEALINRTLIDLCTFFLRPPVFQHLVTNNHSEECKLFQYRIRFELLPDLIKKRQVDLSFGYATGYCSQWKEILVSLFCTYVMQDGVNIKLKAQDLINHDMRLNILHNRIQYLVFKEHVVHGRITAENINTEAYYFPLCMQHLHIRLQKTHRLSHYARFYYSLFLKDSGMQLEDSIRYWKEEYSKPHSCTTICSHSWQTNERKFLYSIRHLYGLEGAKRNYKSPNCRLICESASKSMYEGGCPFKNFDISTLKDLLHIHLSEQMVTEIINSVTLEKPQATCAKFLKLLTKRETEDIVVNNPVEYYSMMIMQE